MKFWHCSSCDHEWQGNKAVCDWCNAEGKLLEEKQSSLEKAIDDMMKRFPKTLDYLA